MSRHIPFFLLLNGFLVLFYSCRQDAGKIPLQEVLTPSPADSVLLSFNERIKKNPNDPELYYQRARYFLDLNDWDAAYADMGRVFILDSSRADYYLTMADINFNRGFIGNVKSDLEKSLLREPDNIQARMKYAEFNLYLKKYPECIQNIDHILKKDLYHAKAYFIKGMAFKEVGDTVKALSSFQTTVDQDPEYYDAYIQLGLLNSHLKNKIAIEYFRSAVKINPTIEAFYALGMFAQENEMYELAIEAYFNILDIDPAYKNAHYNLGYIHSEYLKEYSQSVEHYTNALRADPQYYEAAYMKAYAFERMGDMQNAENNYRLSLKINPDYTLAALGLGRVLD